jgi:hypothetical protein
MGRGFPCGSPPSLIEGDFRAEVLCLTEGLNLSLTFDYKPNGGTLYPPGAQTAHVVCSESTGDTW